MNTPAGYQDIDPAIPDYCNISIQGEERAGKDDLACSWPGPILLMPFDRNYIGPVRRWRAKGRTILTPTHPYFHEYNRQAESQEEVNANAEAARPILKRWREDYRAAISNPDIKTIIIDTESKLYDTLRFATFGKLSKIPPMLYDRVNGKMSQWLSMAQSAPKHVIWLRRLKDEWKNTKNEKGQMVGTPTGKMKAMGWKETGYETQATIRVYRDLEMTWCAEIVDCTLDGNLAGTVFEGKERHYRYIYPVLFGQKPRPRPKE